MSIAWGWVYFGAPQAQVISRGLVYFFSLNRRRGILLIVSGTGSANPMKRASHAAPPCPKLWRRSVARGTLFR